MQPLDFRSDTLTRPTDAMRHAMMEAEVGDDVFGEDPTVTRLEEESARRMGMEAGLYVPSGTMANQVAIWTHTGRMGQIVCEENCHLALYEGGASALLSNVLLRTANTPDGIFAPTDIARHFLPDDPHFAPTRLVCIENTHNYAGGTAWTRDQIAAIVEQAHNHGAPVHVDGARIFNAALARNTTPDRLLEGVDSVMFCLSKGLSAPVGSVLCGTQEFVDKARYARKILGGGMRQAGVIAAAGLIALETMVDRLTEDHANAQALAKGLNELPNITVNLDRVHTNIILADVSATGMMAQPFCDAAAKAGVLCLPRDVGPWVRFVTHRHITSSEIQECLNRLAQSPQASN